MKNEMSALLTDFHDEEKLDFLDSDQEGNWYVATCRFPACRKIIVRLGLTDGNPGRADDIASYLVRPKVAGRPPVPPEVLNAMRKITKKLVW
jgi:hypothetical protein